MLRRIVVSILLRPVRLQALQIDIVYKLSATQQACRHLHDDGSRKKKRITSKAKLCEKEPVTSERDSGRLDGELNSLLGQLPLDKVKAHSSLQERLETLLGVGCTMQQIQERVTILNLSEQTILRRAKVLKDLGRDPVTVDLLFLAGRDLRKLKEKLAAKDLLDQHLCALFRCSMSELALIRKKHPSMRKLKNLSPENINQKVEELHKFGVTAEEMKESPGILNAKIENITVRMQRLNRLRSEGKIAFKKWPLHVVAGPLKRFEYLIKQSLQNRREIDGSLTSLEKIAGRLGVSEKDLQDVCLNTNIPYSFAIERIEYLMMQGLSGHDIVSHVYMLNYTLENLQAAVEQCQRFGIPPSNIYTLLSFLRSGHLPMRSTMFSRQKNFIAKMLGVLPQSLSLGHELRPVWSTDRLTIKRNLDFLQAEGFSMEDIRSCVLLLAHDWKVLQEYYHGMWHRPELANFADSEVWKDRKRVLSVLQYIIEKDMNFASTVFVADVEYGRHGTTKEDEKTHHDPEPEPEYDASYEEEASRS